MTNGIKADIAKKLRFEIKFFNKALEDIIDCDDIKLNLDKQNLIVDGKLCTISDMTRLSNLELGRLDARILNREEHFHSIVAPSSPRNDDESQIISQNANAKWVSFRRQEIIFDDEKCFLLSLRDVTSQHRLEKLVHDQESLKKLLITIQNHLEAPMHEIVKHTKELIKHSRQEDTSPTLINELLMKSLVKQKMSLFRCRDLLEHSESLSNNNESVFKLYKATESISRLI